MASNPTLPASCPGAPWPGNFCRIRLLGRDWGRGPSERKSAVSEQGRPSGGTGQGRTPAIPQEVGGPTTATATAGGGPGRGPGLGVAGAGGWARHCFCPFTVGLTASGAALPRTSAIRLPRGLGPETLGGRGGVPGEGGEGEGSRQPLGQAQKGCCPAMGKEPAGSPEGVWGCPLAPEFPPSL